MPSIMATIGLNANPMRAELAAVQKLAAQAGVNMQNSLSGGGHGHSGSSGIIRESLVLMREMAAGNFTKVPGSLSILLQQMGVLKYIITDTASASRVLADAWAAQSQAASLAAIAATRKAAASQAAFYANAEETEATLVQAAADEEGAAAAIAHAQATQAKAVASAEAVAASGTEAAAGVGALGIIGGALLGLAVGGYAAYKLVSALTEKLSGLKPVDFHPEYITKHLQAANQGAEAQKEINREILKSVDHYNSAAQAAARVAETTKNHFAHLRKLNEYEQDPRKKQVREYDISKAERQQELGNKMAERVNLEIESKAKKAQADAIKVGSKEHDDNRLGLRKKEADEAQKYLDEVEKANNGGEGSIKKKLFRAYNAAALSGVSGGDLDAAEAANKAEANRRIRAYHSTADDVAGNDEARKRKSELDKQAGESMSKATTTALEIARQKITNEQKDKDQLAELRAEIQARKEPRGELSVNEHQKIGAYASLNSSNLQNQMLKTSELSLLELRSIKTLLNKPQMTQSGVEY